MAKYIKQEMPNMNGTEEPQVYYRMKTTRNISSKEFAKHICRNGSAADLGLVESVLIRLADGLSRLLADGYSVTLDGVGTFKASLGLKRGKEIDTFDGDEPKRNARSLQLTGVNFRADKELIREASRHCKLERAYESRLRHSPYTQEERRQQALAYLGKHGAMRIANYMELTGLSRTVATKELMEFRRDPSSGITFIGRGSSKVYVLKQAAEE